MASIFASRKLAIAVAVLFAVATGTQLLSGTETIDPRDMGLMRHLSGHQIPSAVYSSDNTPAFSGSTATLEAHEKEQTPQIANGPTIPPGPWDEKPWPLQLANGPTIPPGPWDEKPWPLQLANGPTIPPGPWDEKPWPVT
jgi:hypothetical protein